MSQYPARILRAALLILPVALSASGCGGCGSDGDGNPQCERDGDCIRLSLCGEDNYLITFPPNDQTCIDNRCVWAPGYIPCASECAVDEDGLAACVGEPGSCDGVTCNEPPEAHCVGDTLVQPEGSGDCNAGACAYEEELINCASSGQICVNGACVDSECPGGCRTPPDNDCDGNDLVEYGSVGRCVDGGCTYDEFRTDCAADGAVCDDAECIDNCADVTCDDPPDSFCDGIGNAHDFASTGTCDPLTGECEYEERTDACVAPEVCLDGGCVDQCGEVTCDEPPRDHCEGTVLVSYAETGTCDAGECDYAESRLDCTAEGGRGCDESGGAHCPGICDLVVCNEPPDRACDGDTAVSFTVPGFCSESTGECEYGEVRRDCTDTDQICRDGDCVGPCTGVECEEPPPGICDGDIRHFFVVPGTCAPLTGECSYDPASEDCSDREFLCTSGYCYDPCEDVSCTEGPVAYCDENVAVSFAGVCNFRDQTCSYPEIRTDCAARAMTCDSGRCR